MAKTIRFFGVLLGVMLLVSSMSMILEQHSEFETRAGQLAGWIIPVIYGVLLLVPFRKIQRQLAVGFLVVLAMFTLLSTLMGLGLLWVYLKIPNLDWKTVPLGLFYSLVALGNLWVFYTLKIGNASTKVNS
ncbi:MAG: hypothetical protein CVU57_20990 [Deltaproteobacteria bacterium HGW-Deltaproteobacteria-15]|jgi:hypothetical protein|nr:MAG: hypothetical protein CVU57_20990 [Deltaproteobacteria bacterium HGW-Deltaproteobacteria-15]